MMRYCAALDQHADPTGLLRALVFGLAGEGDLSEES
jgi:hypothetical protein